MSRYLMVLWSGGGSVPPQLAVAKRLLRAGHEVSILAPRSLAATIETCGATFEPYRRAPEHDASDPQLDLLRDWEVRGPAAPARMRDNVMFGTAAGICDDVLALVTARPPDVLVTDYLLLGSFLAAEKAAIPVAALMHSIFTLPRAGLPPFGPGLSPARGKPGRLRDTLLKRLQNRFYNARLDDLNSLRRDLELPPVKSGLDVITSADRLLILTSPAFDYPGPVHANARWAGAITDPDLPSPPLRSAQPRNESQSVLVSLSTTFQRQGPVLERVIEALAELPVQAVVTCGPAITPSEVPSPPNVRVLASAPHHELLPTTDLLVTHGGHGTVIAALRHGVPVLCLPMGRDQRDIAARVAWHGAGIRVPAKTSTQRLRHLIGEALQDPNLRTAAEQLAIELNRDDQDLAVRELEELANTPSKR